MGSGAFGSNGSVHWEIAYGDGPNAKADHRDYDDSKRHPADPSVRKRALPVIGQGKAKNRFRITARYPTKAAAISALTKALERAEGPKGSKIVVLKVDLRNFRKRSGKPKNWEVKIDW
jgi:hypothetical protein